jgi:folate-binding protein YgfZ
MFPGKNGCIIGDTDFIRQNKKFMGQFEFLSNRTIISCKGVDSEKFLQGLFTNDVRQNFCYSMMLLPSSKFLFDFFVYKIDAEQYLIDSSSIQLLSKLLLYKMRNRVFIENVSHEYAVAFSNVVLDFMSEFYTFADSRNSKMGVRCILPRGFLEGYMSKSHLNLYLEAKYHLAIPDGDLDMIVEKSFPLEFGLTELNGVSYTKGCYLGQEAIARGHHTGVIRKHVYKIMSEEDLTLVSKDSQILCNSVKVGVFCSGYKNLGIGLIRTQDLDLKGELTLNGKQISLEKAPWY